MADEKKILIDVQVNIDNAIKALAETKSQIEVLRASQKSLGKVTDENRAEYEAYAAQIRQLTTVSRQQQKEIDNTIKAQKAEDGSTEQLRAKLSLLTAQYDSLSRAQKKSAQGKELANSINEISSEVKESNQSIGNFRDSVGEYENKIKSALGIQNSFIGGLFNMQNGANQAGVSFGKQLVSGVGAASKALLSLLANPIILFVAAIIAALKILYDLFKSYDPLIDILEQGFAALSAIFSSLKDTVLSVITGQKSLKDAISGTGDAMTKAAKAAIEMKKAEQDLDDMNWKATVNQEKYKNQINELILQSKNRTLSEKERLKLIDEALKVEEKAFKEKKSISDQEVKIAQLAIISKHNLTQQEINLLKQKGVEYAIYLKSRKAVTDDEVKALADALANQQKDYGESISIREKAQNRADQLAEKAAEDAQKAAEKRKEIARKIAKAEVDIQNIKSQTIIDKQNEIANNDKKSYTDRLEALGKSEAEQIAIINRNRDLELKNKELTEAERNAITQKAAFDVAKIKADTEKTITDIEAKELDNRLKLEAENLAAKKQQLSNDQSKELKELSDKFAKGNISATEYEKQKLEIAQKYRELDFNQSVLALASQLGIENLNADQRKEIERQIAETKNKYAQESAQIAIQANEKIVETEKQAAEKRKEIEQQLSDKKKELFSQLQNTIQDITNSVFERKNNEVDEETQKITDSYDAQIKAAEGNDKRQAQLEAQKQKKLDEQDAKKRKLARQQAISERLFAAFSVGLSTTKAVMAALAPPPTGLGPVAGIPLAITVGGIGALQLASVLAAPLPKAAKGKVFKGKSHAQGGIPVEVEGDEMILTKGVYRNPALREIASVINQAGGGIPLSAGTSNTYMATGGVLSNALFQNDGGYSARSNSSVVLTKDDIKQAMSEAVKGVKIITTVEDIRKADANYVNLENRANF